MKKEYNHVLLSSCVFCMATEKCTLKKRITLLDSFDFALLVYGVLALSLPHLTLFLAFVSTFSRALSFTTVYFVLILPRLSMNFFVDPKQKQPSHRRAKWRGTYMACVKSYGTDSLRSVRERASERVNEWVEHARAKPSASTIAIVWDSRNCYVD